jgi:hypothetical protein
MFGTRAFSTQLRRLTMYNFKRSLIMRIGIATYRRSLVLLLVLTMSVIGSPSSAAADDFENLKPWTTVGSAGTVDEASLSAVSLNGPFASVRATATLPATVIIRYNVTAVDGLVVGSGHCFEVIFRDNGSGGRVIVTLKRFNFSTFETTTLSVIDSDTLPPDPWFVGIGLCGISGQFSNPSQMHFFDFEHNAYYVEAQIIKTADGGNPTLASVRLRT